MTDPAQSILHDQRGMSGPQVVGILLAAGRSRRFGADKRVAVLSDGTTLLGAALRALQTATDRVLVVLRLDDRDLAAQLTDGGVPWLACPDADLGMGHSLAAAARHLHPPVPHAPGVVVPAVLVALGDMPCIQPATYALLVQALRTGATLVRPTWQGQAGHPVGFGPALLSGLGALQGEHGARALVQAAGDTCTWIAVEDPGIVRDVDTPEALATFVTHSC